MSLTLKKDPEWLETLQQADASLALALLIGDDGCQVSVPVAILVAVSPLVRSISAVLLPPAICPVALSVLGVPGDVLKIVVELMMKGKSYILNAEQSQKIYEVFEVLGIEAVLNSYYLECCEINVEVKYENAIDAFEIGKVEDTHTNDSKLEEKNIKVELNGKREKVESTPLRDRKAKRKIQTRNQCYGCDECEYKTKGKTSFLRHVRIHTGEKPFECDQCEYTASMKDNLMRHKRRVHAVVKPYVCDECDFKSSESFQLRRHKRIHSGEKPYACDQCKYKASDECHLRTHNRIHTGEKPFACDQCEYRATQFSSLITHKKIHTCEEPHECDQCDYKCSVGTRFIRHMRVIHQVEKPFKCDLCEYKAKKWRELVNHRRMHK